MANVVNRLLLRSTLQKAATAAAAKVSPSLFLPLSTSLLLPFCLAFMIDMLVYSSYHVLYLYTHVHILWIGRTLVITPTLELRHFLLDSGIPFSWMLTTTYLLAHHQLAPLWASAFSSWSTLSLPASLSCLILLFLFSLEIVIKTRNHSNSKPSIQVCQSMVPCPKTSTQIITLAARCSVTVFLIHFQTDFQANILSLMLRFPIIIIIIFS